MHQPDKCIKYLGPISMRIPGILLTRALDTLLQQSPHETTTLGAVGWLHCIPAFKLVSIRVCIPKVCEIP